MYNLTWFLHVTYSYAPWKEKQANKQTKFLQILYRHAVASHCATKTGIKTWGQSEVRHALIWPLWPQSPPPSSPSSPLIVSLQGIPAYVVHLYREEKLISSASLSPGSKFFPFYMNRNFPPSSRADQNNHIHCHAWCPKDSCPLSPISVSCSPAVFPRMSLAIVTLSTCVAFSVTSPRPDKSYVVNKCCRTKERKLSHCKRKQIQINQRVFYSVW